jgi:phage-related protein
MQRRPRRRKRAFFSAFREGMRIALHAFITKTEKTSPED